MKNKHCFFRTPNHLHSREIPAHAQNFTELGLQKAKLDHVFDDDDPSPYADSLCRALWGVSYQQIYRAPILGFSLPRTQDPVISIRKNPPYVVNNGRCLDLPGLSNDYFVTPICWATEELTYIGLESKLYSYNVIKLQSKKINVGSIADSPITALAYNSSLSVLVRAGSDSSLQFIDTHSNKQTRLNHAESAHTNIVSDMNHGFYMIGKTSHALIHYDLREHTITHSAQFPNSMLTGLAINKHTLAISTDGCIQLYDARKWGKPQLNFEGHNPPSKALDFSPNTGKRIVTGGGAGDQTLKVWNTDTGKIIAQKNMGNLICGVHWLDHDGFFVTQGCNNNGVSCWSIQDSKLSMDASSTLHSDEILFSAQNPVNKDQLITASSGMDESLRFWSVSNTKKPVKVSETSSSLTLPIIR